MKKNANLKSLLLYILMFAVFGLCFGRLFVVYGIWLTENSTVLFLYLCIFTVLVISTLMARKDVLVLNRADGVNLIAFSMIIYYTIVFCLKNKATDFFVPWMNIALSLVIFICTVNMGKIVRTNQIQLSIRIGMFCYFAFVVLFIYSKIHGFTYFYSLEMSTYYAQFQNSIYYVLFSLPFCLCSENKYMKYVALVMAIICVLMSFKMTSLLGIIASVYFYVRADSNINAQKYSTKLLRRIQLFLLFGAIAIVAVYVVGQQYGFTVLDKIENSYASGGSGRTEIYRQVIKKQMHSGSLEWMFGHGYDMVNEIVGISAHNDFLEILFDFGLIGFSLYIMFIVSIVKCINRLKLKKSRLYPPMVISFVFFVFLSLFSHIFQIKMYGMIFMLFSGLALSFSYEDAAEPDW